MFHHETLAACPACSCQFFVEEPACPHCGEAIRKAERGTFPRAAASLAMGLALAAIPLAACGDDTGGGSGGGGGDGGAAAQSGSQSSSDSSSTSQSSAGGEDTTNSVASAYGVGPGGGDDSVGNGMVSAYGIGASAGF